ncbi:hypothetical protein [Paraflavitalea pollutisoli]|uniref:hypothetical protein n=1 Tax=Paraflavitalea pollutisoli TaxID=3034143 RepID=UPI0023ED0E51|nr:hypothetical protein [Paraflavitalea sp. H1-2-19X]
MKHWFWIILLSLAGTGARAQCPTLAEARTLYEQAAGAENTCTQFITRLQQCGRTGDPAVWGYRGAAIMLMAKHAGSPFSKLSYFKKGRKVLDSALAAHPGDIELRYLRFTIQTNVPSLLGYNDEIKADKQYLINHLAAVTDNKLYNNIYNYLQQSKYVTGQEKQGLRQKPTAPVTAR